MLAMIDFNDAEIARGVYYGGDAGAKNAILYEGEAWMLKYPKTAGTLAVMPEIQKDFYLRLMQIRLDQVLLPAAATVASQG